MNTTYGTASSFALCLLVTTAVAAQEAAEEGVPGKTDNIIAETQAKVDDIAEQIDENEKAKEVSAGILQPIYALAEYLSFPAVHWVAFAIMATGVVTFALQLVLGKLVVLLKAGFSFTEILSDTLGLAISVVGLVLTTQAAAENSNFTQSPAAVLSASCVGVVLGFIFYLWGQSQEIQALRGKRSNAAKS
jgi:ABC-type multidrug transport system fused ATPase/permease subunit